MNEQEFRTGMKNPYKKAEEVRSVAAHRLAEGQAAHNLYEGLPRQRSPLSERLDSQGDLKPVPVSVQATLNERGKRYGAFEGHAAITQQLKNLMRGHSGWGNLNHSQEEALEMIAHKIGRILNGDPNYKDSWVDIAGYAQLVANQLKD